MAIIPGAEHLYALIRRETERTMRMIHKPSRVGLVSSYDKKLHAIKVRFQPEGTTSGWIPLTPLAAGNKFGIVAPPNIKDQVEINHQEGDHMVGRVIQRHFSQQADVAPEAEAGEYHMIHGSGSVLRFLKDGSVQLGGGKTVETGEIGKGQSGDLSTQGEDDQESSGQQQQPDKPDAKQLLTYDAKGNVTHSSPNGNFTHTVGKSYKNTSNDHTRETTSGDITDTSKGNIGRSAQKSITDSAKSIVHNGQTSINGGLAVSGASSFGTASFNLDETGHFNATTGGEVTGGLSSDTLMVTSTSTFSGLITATAGASIAGGLTADTLTVTGSPPWSVTPPATKTGNYSMGATDSSLIFNGSGAITLTLQSASTNSGRFLYVKTIAAFAVNSASSNVVPVGTATAGTAILAGTAGKWAILQSDGTNWITMAAN